MNNYRHLNIRDRIRIEFALNNYYYYSLSKLARELNVSSITVYREIKRNSTYLLGKKVKFMHYRKDDPRVLCSKHNKFPYVCNGCPGLVKCAKNQKTYNAYVAEDKYQLELRRSRANPRIKSKALRQLDDKVSNRVKAKQSLYHILETDKSINVSESTLRRYINKGYLSCITMDLPRTIRFEEKKDRYVRTRPLPAEVINNRTYLDYLDYTSTANRVTLQLDTVIGKIDDSKCILTIFEPKSKLQLGFIISKKAKAVNKRIKWLIELLKKINNIFFDSILTDNGSEFRLLPLLEADEETGEFYFRTFYCNPYASYQKAGCERNHELFRYFYEKGKTLDYLTQNELNQVFSHINSLKRKSLNGLSPIEVFESLYSIDVEIFGINYIKPRKLKMKK